MRNAVIARTYPTLRAQAKQDLQIARNVVIDWVVFRQMPKRLRSIVLGCLRTTR